MSFRGCAAAILQRCFNRTKTSSSLCINNIGAGRRAAAMLCVSGMSIALGIGAAVIAPYVSAQQLMTGDSASALDPGVTSGAPATPAQPPADSKPNGALYGTVMDSNAGILSGATVALSGPVSRTTTSDASGKFSFTGLPPGTYSVKVTGNGMSPAQASNIDLRPGGVRFLPPVVLQVAAASTSIQVFGNPEMLAEEQLQLQLHQRVLGFLPNFYSSYDWNAVHLWPKQKFEIGYRSEIDPITFAIIAAQAGVDQYYGRFAGYGGGLQGYAKRYGADYGTEFIGSMIGDVVMPSLLHQDPRYFYKGTGSFGSRAMYALSRTFICRGDDGHQEFDYSRIVGDLAAGGIANAYYPPENRGLTLVFTSTAVDLGANAATNLIREFILPGLTSHVPKGIREKSPIHF